MAAPLFLLAPPRSYTSLVNAMLGQHPQAFGLPELCLFNVEKLVDLWVGVEGENAERGAMARHGLMRAVAEISSVRRLACEVSLDPWMGCGLGTCLGCVVKDQEGRYRRACIEGPVFPGECLKF